MYGHKTMHKMVSGAAMPASAILRGDSILVGWRASVPSPVSADFA
jgi:hypothetical protein